MLPRLRQQEWNEAIKKVQRNFNDTSKARKLHVELDHDFNNMFGSTIMKMEVFAGLENKLIENLQLTKCKRKEAKFLMIIGEKDIQTGCFIIGKCKTYWLK
jgi:hypothetical protein